MTNEKYDQNLASDISSLIYKQNNIGAVSSMIEEDRLRKLFQGLLEEYHIYGAAIKEITTKLEILSEEFRIKKDRNPIHNIESRLKSMISITRKLQALNLELGVKSAKENLHDIAGIRVICYYIDDIYDIANILLSQNDINLINIKDYIKNPKPNGYRSLHLVITVPVFLSDRKVDTQVEIQIRTIAMDFWATLEHHLNYKSSGVLPPELKRELVACSEESARLDERMQEIYKKSLCRKE